jgi:hypothetical protein
MKTANHQESQTVYHQKKRQMLVGRAFSSQVVINKNCRCNHFSGGWNRQSDKMPFGCAFGLDVVTRQPQCAANDVSASCQPSPVAPGNKRPEINQYRWRYTKRHDICERVEFDAKLASGVGQPRRIAVDAIEYIGQDNEEHRLNVFPIERGYDREKAAHDVAGGEQAGD